MATGDTASDPSPRPWPNEGEEGSLTFKGDSTILARPQRPGRQHHQRARPSTQPGRSGNQAVNNPQRLSRGLALVKWWLLAIPQYIIIGLFTGGMAWWGWYLYYHGGVLHAGYGYRNESWAGFGLIGLLAVIGAVVLLVTGRYPERIFDFVLGMNRWVLRVAGYAGLMTDKYPPFRLDMGGPDPGTLTLPPTGAGPG